MATVCSRAKVAASASCARSRSSSRPRKATRRTARCGCLAVEACAGEFMVLSRDWNRRPPPQSVFTSLGFSSRWFLEHIPRRAAQLAGLRVNHSHVALVRSWFVAAVFFVLWIFCCCCCVVSRRHVHVGIFVVIGLGLLLHRRTGPCMAGNSRFHADREAWGTWLHPEGGRVIFSRRRKKNTDKTATLRTAMRLSSRFCLFCCEAKQAKTSPARRVRSENLLKWRFFFGFRVGKFDCFQAMGGGVFCLRSA